MTNNRPNSKNNAITAMLTAEIAQFPALSLLRVVAFDQCLSLSHLTSPFLNSLTPFRKPASVTGSANRIKQSVPLLQNRQATIKDVAQQAQVSQHTVSSLMNNYSDVSNETWQRVQQVAASLNYIPGQLVRGLTRKRSLTCGVIGAGVGYYGPSRMLVGIEKEANRLGYSPIVSLFHGPERSNPELLTVTAIPAPA